jgi:hypothetical protein
VSRPYHVVSWLTRFSSTTPAALELLRFPHQHVDRRRAMPRPRISGMAQKAHVWSQPSLIFRYDVWRVLVESIRSGRSMAGTASAGADAEQAARTQLRYEPLRFGQPEEQVDFRQFLLEVVLVSLDEAAHRHDRPEAAVLLESDWRPGSCRPTPPSPRR